MRDSNHIYLIRFQHYYKIGISSDPERRLRDLQTAFPEKLRLVSSFKVNEARFWEEKIHELLKVFHVNGEWFLVDREGAENLLKEILEIAASAKI